MPAVYHARTRHAGCTCHQGGTPDEAAELSGSVGEGGVNRECDVLAVQAKLNRVDPADGGPAVPLDEDGLCGPLTRAAILKFQKRYAPPLLTDGRIDVNKNTWKKLASLTGGGGGPVQAGAAQPKGKKAPTPPAPPMNLPLAMTTLNAALFAAQLRVFEAIKCLDVAAGEVSQVQAHQAMNSVFTPISVHQSFQAVSAGMQELPTVDRVFKIAHPKMTLNGVREVIRRLRKVYADMVEVTVATLITTPNAETSGVKRFVRPAPNSYFVATYKGGAVANAPEAGWWTRNANVFHIKYNYANLFQQDVATGLIHEMGHFVSSHAGYWIGQHHKTGEYNGAFNDTHAQAVRNAFCYEWYALLAAGKHLRATPNAALVLT